MWWRFQETFLGRAATHIFFGFIALLVFGFLAAIVFNEILSTLLLPHN